MSQEATGDLRKLYLGGQWVATDQQIEVRNPATMQVFARVAAVGRPAVAEALAAAERVAGPWREVPALSRARLLVKVAGILERRCEEIARTLTLENGKPLAQSRTEVRVSADHFHWFAGECQRAYGRVVPQQVPNKRHMVLRVPIGVVGAISPWNFPLMLSARKVAPALAAGCPVILKPASATPLCALHLAEAIDEAGLPPGVFQVVAGNAAEIGGEFLSNPLCRKVTFTGSTEVGQELVRGAAKQLTKLSLELGGHAPVLVFADADLETAVQGALIAKIRNTGQSCIAANRIYVQRSIAEPFLAALVARTSALKVGNGLDDGVEIGPLINEAALQHALAQIDQARKAGARLLCGGKRWTGGAGYFLEPTVLADVPVDAECMHEETFAPVTPVSIFDDESEAVKLANNTRYGLAAYAFTRDFSRAWRLSEQLEFGTVCINDSVPSTSQSPFGGTKQSGWGRELGSEGLDAFLETKHISIAIDSHA